jgi:hypothetical protein
MILAVRGDALRMTMVLRTLATGKSPHGGAVDGMFVARTHSQDLPGAVIDLAIDEPEPAGTSNLTRASPVRSPLTWRRPRSLEAVGRGRRT